MKNLTLLLISVLLLFGCGPIHDGSNSVDVAQQSQVSWPSVSGATNVAPSPNDVAIIVGIEDYVFLPDVLGARETALDWATFFREGLGTQNVFLVLDQDGTREGISRAVSKAINVSNPQGKLWFVFVGHGAPNKGGEGMLVGADAQQNFDSLKARSVSQASVLDSLARAQSSHQIVVVDACFSGRASDGALLAKGTQPVIPTQLSITPPTHTVVLTAARGDELAGSLPRGTRPAFSYLALGALRGWAADASGNVTAEGLVRYTSAQLRHVPSRTQTPSVHGDGAMILASGAKESDPGIANLMIPPRPVSDAPKSADAPVVQASRRFDSGFGLKMSYSNRWQPVRLESGDLEDKGSSTVARFDHTLSRGRLVVQQMPSGDVHFETNLKTLHRSWLQEGAILLDSRDHGDGVWREYAVQRGSDTLRIVMWYVAGSNAMWSIGGVVPESDRQSYATDLELLIESAEFD